MTLSHIEIIEKLNHIEVFGKTLNKEQILQHIHNLRLAIIDRPENL